MRRIPILVWVACWLAAIPGRAQDEARIKKLFQDAILAMGGDAFSKVTDIVGEGNYFMFDRNGNSSGLIKYNDYTKLPDKSRNELGSKKKLKDVTVFDLSRSVGWILEGQKDTRNATPEELKSFKSSVKHALDNVFRTRYKDSANKLFYLGVGEGSDVAYELVRLIDPENDDIVIYFDRMSKLPAKIEYKVLSAQGVQLREVDEFSGWHEFQGVKVPLRVDHTTNGRRASQLFLVNVTLNNNLEDSLFTKPEAPK